MASTATSNSLNKLIIFGCEYFFLPEGVQSLTKRLTKEIGERNLVCHFLFNLFNLDSEHAQTVTKTGGESCWA